MMINKLELTDSKYKCIPIYEFPTFRHSNVWLVQSLHSQKVCLYVGFLWALGLTPRLKTCKVQVQHKLHLLFRHIHSFPVPIVTTWSEALKRAQTFIGVQSDSSRQYISEILFCRWLLSYVILGRRFIT